MSDPLKGLKPTPGPVMVVGRRILSRSQFAPTATEVCLVNTDCLTARGKPAYVKPPNARSLVAAVCTVRAAKRWCVAHHRHLKRLNGARWAVAVRDRETGEVLGVAAVSNGPREWEGTGRANLARVAVLDGIPNACSFLYGAVRRAARELGYREVWTYTLEDEPGVSLRAAGYEYRGQSAGGTHSRKSRPRADPEEGGAKGRWCATLRPPYVWENNTIVAEVTK